MWVFAYGSLLWNPGFRPVEAVTARLAGYRRSFCMLSIHYRGTVEAPGLVLALDAEPGAECVGVALRVDEAEAAEVLDGLRARELVSSAYAEREVDVALADGRRVRAVAYVISRGHAQYCTLPIAEQARIIAAAAGDRGPNCDYLYNTAAHLRGLDITDPDLDDLEHRVRLLRGAG